MVQVGCQGSDNKLHQPSLSSLAWGESLRRRVLKASTATIVLKTVTKVRGNLFGLIHRCKQTMYNGVGFYSNKWFQHCIPVSKKNSLYLHRNPFPCGRPDLEASDKGGTEPSQLGGVPGQGAVHGLPKWLHQKTPSQDETICLWYLGKCMVCVPKYIS